MIVVVVVVVVVVESKCTKEGNTSEILDKP
jgi:hypothetical protein